MPHQKHSGHQNRCRQNQQSFFPYFHGLPPLCFLPLFYQKSLHQGIPLFRPLFRGMMKPSSKEVSPMPRTDVTQMLFSKVYPLLVSKARRKAALGRKWIR